MYVSIYFSLSISLSIYLFLYLSLRIYIFEVDGFRCAHARQNFSAEPRNATCTSSLAVIASAQTPATPATEVTHHRFRFYFFSEPRRCRSLPPSRPSQVRAPLREVCLTHTEPFSSVSLARHELTHLVGGVSLMDGELSQSERARTHAREREINADLSFVSVKPSRLRGRKAPKLCSTSPSLLSRGASAAD